MKLYVLFGQRKQDYDGQYGLEALACMTEHDAEGNGDYLPEQEAKAAAGGEFAALRVVTLDVSEKALLAELFPARAPIPAVVSKG